MRLRYNNAVGTLGASLTSGGTTITFSSAPAFATITGTDYIPLVLEPPSASPSASFEIVYLTAYTAAATTGTILRGQEGTTGVAHNTGVIWVDAAIINDIPSQMAAVNITASESRTNTAYGTLTTPDQVTGIVLPTNGLIAVWYQATWQESVASAARAAIFIGATQMRLATDNITGNQAETVYQQAKTSAAGTGTNYALSSALFGLASLRNAVTVGGHVDVTTGQVVGMEADNGVSWEKVDPGNAGNTTGASATQTIGGGPCYIFAAAGTYTVSVQFKASSGSVTASNRKLWVEVKLPI